jgi:hypothetical protein
MVGSPPSGLNLGVVMGPDSPAYSRRSGRNIRENRLGMLSTVLNRA